MDRAQAIEIIARLYPADSECFTTRQIGEQLMNQARREQFDWRTLPDEVLARYAVLCLEMDNWARITAERNRRYGL